MDQKLYPISFTLDELKELNTELKSVICVIYGKDKEEKAKLIQHPYYSAINKIANTYYKQIFGYTEWGDINELTVWT